MSGRFFLAGHLSGQKFKKLLVVHKNSRWTRYMRKGVLGNRNLKESYKAQLQTQHNTNQEAIRLFAKRAKYMGKDIYVVPDCEIDPEDDEERKRLIDGVDMVISMGGDHTFLKSSALIRNQDIPIMGVSTTSDYTAGALNIIGIDPEN